MTWVKNTKREIQKLFSKFNSEKAKDPMSANSKPISCCNLYSTSKLRSGNHFLFDIIQFKEAFENKNGQEIMKRVLQTLQLISSSNWTTVDNGNW
jgi:hypothetical protein